jgi:hypothetical protein
MVSAEMCTRAGDGQVAVVLRGKPDVPGAARWGAWLPWSLQPGAGVMADLQGQPARAGPEAVLITIVTGILGR